MVILAFSEIVQNIANVEPEKLSKLENVEAVQINKFFSWGR